MDCLAATFFLSNTKDADPSGTGADAGFDATSPFFGLRDTASCVISFWGAAPTCVVTSLEGNSAVFILFSVVTETNAVGIEVSGTGADAGFATSPFVGQGDTASFVISSWGAPTCAAPGIEVDVASSKEATET